MWNWMLKCHELNMQGKAFALVTVVEVKGAAPRDVGAKMVVLEAREKSQNSANDFFGTIGGGQLELLAIEDARKYLTQNKTGTVEYPLGEKAGQCCGGVVRVLIESHAVGPCVHVFGAGHVGQAIARVLLGTPFRVCVYDEREEWLRELPQEVDRMSDDLSRVVDAIDFAAHDIAVVLTHSHDLDRELIAKLCKKPIMYVGLIGSKNKWSNFQRRLLAEGLAQAELDRVHCPIGLSVAGKAPQEVAISFAAQILQLHYRGDTKK